MLMLPTFGEMSMILIIGDNSGDSGLHDFSGARTGALGRSGGKVLAGLRRCTG